MTLAELKAERDRLNNKLTEVGMERGELIKAISRLDREIDSLDGARCWACNQRKGLHSVDCWAVEMGMDEDLTVPPPPTTPPTLFACPSANIREVEK